MLLPERHILSKSTFMMGYQCPKRLWLHKYMPAVRDEMGDAQQAIFQRGTDVGMLARELFPGGVDASPIDSFHYQQSVADTAQHMREGKKVIYEAAFQYDGLLCAIDILVKKDNEWYGYEVKSTTSVKPPFLKDAALQYYVIRNAGLDLKNIFVTHLNNKYIRMGSLDVQQLFSHISVINEVLDLQSEINEKAKELKAILKNKEIPVIGIGDHCDKPYHCDFYSFCSEGMEEDEPDYGSEYINTGAIHEFLEELEYPLYHIDFETWMTAVPEFDGHWPYRQVCFQYSVHTQRTSGGEPEHHHYLAEGVHSPSLEFLEALIKVLGKKGTVLVYNQAFEYTRLRELAKEHPQYQKAIESIINRVVDLMVVFRKHYRLPEMQGSYSIKYVLPALLPELSYDELAIGNGGDASAAFFNLRQETDAEIIRNTREALLEYCGLDTLAMVKILEKLNQIIVQ